MSLKISDIKPEDIDLKAPHGAFNTKKYEPSSRFQYNAAECETVLPEGNETGEKGNAYIVFGRDRPSDLSSGYGGKGHNKSYSIDIVAGRMSSFDAREVNGYINPSIGADASRVYLSQKCDVDKYFGIVDGRTGGNSVGRAAIAVKSDDVRIIARNTLKLVTGTDARLSVDEPAFITTGIQLIANNDDRDMQPIPKGHNLVKYLDEIIERVQEVCGIVNTFMKVQDEFNKALAHHTHMSPFFGIPTSPSPDVVQSSMETSMQLFFKVEQGLINAANNLVATKLKYTLPGKNYINSTFHFLN